MYCFCGEMKKTPAYAGDHNDICADILFGYRSNDPFVDTDKEE